MIKKRLHSYSLNYSSHSNFVNMPAYTDDGDECKFLFFALFSCLPLYHYFNKPRSSKSASKSSSREHLHGEAVEMEPISPVARPP